MHKRKYTQRSITPLADRFWAKVFKHPNPERPLPLRELTVEEIDALTPEEKGCWEWQAGKNPDGYGQIGSGRRGPKVSAHRVGYTIQKGIIPEDLVVDHVCRVRHCVNADHMDLVTTAVNFYRGREVQKKLCKAGHDRTNPENIYEAPNGRRHCRICMAQRYKTYLKNPEAKKKKLDWQRNQRASRLAPVRG